MRAACQMAVHNDFRSTSKLWVQPTKKKGARRSIGARIVPAAAVAAAVAAAAATA